MRHTEDFVDVPNHLELGKYAFLALGDRGVFLAKNPQNQHVFWCIARLGVYLPENKTYCNPAKTINLQLQILVTTHCDE